MRRKIFLIGWLGLLIGFGISWAVHTQQVQSSVILSPVGEVAISATPTPSDSPVPVPSLDPVITEPVRVEIPRLAITAAVEDVGLDEEKRMDVPKQDENVAWYTLGPRPGEAGSAVIAGHYDAKTGGPAIFYKLDQVKTGDIITVTTEDQRQLEFKVTRVATHDDATFPIEEVFDFSPTGKRLTLITCRGTFDQATQNYSQRLVVYSDMI